MTIYDPKLVVLLYGTVFPPLKRDTKQTWCQSLWLSFSDVQGLPLNDKYRKESWIGDPDKTRCPNKRHKIPSGWTVIPDLPPIQPQGVRPEIFSTIYLSVFIKITVTSFTRLSLRVSWWLIKVRGEIMIHCSYLIATALWPGLHHGQRMSNHNIYADMSSLPIPLYKHSQRTCFESKLIFPWKNVSDLHIMQMKNLFRFLHKANICYLLLFW